MTTLALETRGAVRLIHLNRPEVRNALSADMVTELSHTFSKAADDKDVRAVVLTGTGKAFCAGLDLSELKAVSSRSAEVNRANSERLGKLFEQIYRFPKPVVAAVNGHAVAGGAGLASVCDFAVLSENAKVGYTEARIGFVAALVGVFLIRQVGERIARDLLLSARLVEADEALRLGLVNEVLPAEEVLARGLELAKMLSQNAPSSLTLTKELLANLPGMGLSESLRYAADLNALVRNTADIKEGVAAFLEKREPAWRP